MRKLLAPTYLWFTPNENGLCGIGLGLCITNCLRVPRPHRRRRYRHVPF